MIHIDGKFGEGGGQILRSSLALSMVTGKAFRIFDIRAGRRKPGLLRQHLTAVNAATEISNAKVQGDFLGSGELTFVPGKIRGGEYRFSVGTAGSATLVFQTILPALMLAEEASELILEGGTHNPMAPPFEFLDEVFRPVVEKMGWNFSLELERCGFYPAGGGRFTARIQPVSSMAPLDLRTRGEVTPSVEALSANIPAGIREDEAAMLLRRFAWDSSVRSMSREVESPGPGNVLFLRIRSPEVTEIFTSFGEKNLSRARVVADVARQGERYLTASTPVGEHLADQLLLPCAMAGAGSFRTLEPTQHAKTNAVVIQKFLDVKIDFEQQASDDWLVTVRR